MKLLFFYVIKREVTPLFPDDAEAASDVNYGVKSLTVED